MTIQKILDYNNIAVVGISDNPERPSNFVARFLIEHGYNV
ncbi:MAG: CoA-binding protein, partial [Spirochaetes bacterium]|nr:CoA-binding protein [Spirochaetota bacterium]